MRRELAEELESDVEEKVADLIDAGVAEHDARKRACREFGNATVFAEIGRDVWGWNWREILWKDIRYWLRGMRHNLGFTTVAVVTLGLGIGANTTMFSFIDAFFLRPLPVEQPYRLVSVFGNPHPDAGFLLPRVRLLPRSHRCPFGEDAEEYRAGKMVVRRKSSTELRNQFGFEHFFYGLAANKAHVINLHAGLSRYDALDRVVLEVETGVVGTRVAGLKLARLDQFHIKQPAIPIVVRTVTTL
jgi:hypothetical protein